MHHQRIALTSLPLLQRQQLIWCLCRTHRYTRSRQCTHTMLFCHNGAKRCSEEAKIAPPQSNLLGVDQTWCYVVMTQCHQLTTPGAETIQTESSNHSQINDMVSALGRAGWWRCNFFTRDTEKLMLLAIRGSGWEIGWFGVSFLMQTLTKIPLKSSYQGLLIDVIKIWLFRVKSYNNNFWRYKIALVARGFGSAQTRQ